MNSESWGEVGGGGGEVKKSVRILKSDNSCTWQNEVIQAVLKILFLLSLIALFLELSKSNTTLRTMFTSLPLDEVSESCVSRSTKDFVVYI